MLIAAVATNALSQPTPPLVKPRVTLGESATGRLSSSPARGVSEHFRMLREKAVNGDKLRVIVGVRTPFAPEGALSPTVTAVQRREIGRAQAAVERRLPRSDQARIHKFSSLPFIAMDVDIEQLDALGDMDEVTHIQEDQQRKLLLDTSIPFIRADQNWASGYTGNNWAVAVLDDGIQNTHPFLSSRIVSEACYSSHYPGSNLFSLCPGYATSSVASGSASNCLLPDSSYLWACTHGTHVAGISSGSGSTGGVSYSGVAKTSPIISVQVFTWDNSAGDVGAFDSDIIKGLNRVYELRTSHNIASVNMSLGGGAYTSQSACDADNTPTKAAIDQLRSVGIATIIASGNNGYYNGISAPGCISSAVSVGATLNSSNSVASYSNSASFLDLLAPGSTIMSSVPLNTYDSYNGTSMATPHVAGCWSVLKSAKPAATPDEIENALKSTGVPVTDTKSGIITPRIDCKAAQDLLLGTGSTFYELTVAITGNGTGTITSSPGGINCGNTCLGNFAEGTAVTLTASPAAGDKFLGWSGACTGTGSCIVNMTSARSVTASFQAGEAVLVLNQQGLSGTTGSTRNFSFAVPASASNLRIEMTAGAGISTGDADLYVRFGAPPNTTTYDCRPYLQGNYETCSIATPAAGTYYAMVVARSDYTNVNLRATYDLSCTSPTVTLSGTITSALSHNTCAPITTSGSVRLTSTADVQLRSDEYIRLSPGFRIDSGARLRATTD